MARLLTMDEAAAMVRVSRATWEAIRARWGVGAAAECRRVLSEMAGDAARRGAREER